MANYGPTPQYDKPFYIPCIVDFSALKPEDVQPLLDLLKGFNPQELKYVSDGVPAVLAEMQVRGYPNIANYPVHLSSQEANVVFARCIRAFNEFGAVRREPDASRVNRTVTSVNDYMRLVDDFTVQQDSITLSQFWGTANIKTAVFYTTRASIVCDRLSRNVIRVGRAKTNKLIEERAEKLYSDVNMVVNNVSKVEQEEFQKTLDNIFVYR